MKDYNISWNINRKLTTTENPNNNNSASIVEEVLIGQSGEKVGEVLRLLLVVCIM